MPTAIVVGSGPNGLAAGLVLARAGLSVDVLEAADTLGGGARSSSTIFPGLVVDHCSAVHPLAAASPYFRALDLTRHGLEFVRAPIDLAHPLPHEEAGILTSGLDETAAGLARDEGLWRRVFEPFDRRFDNLLAELLRPVPHKPASPVVLARFGTLAVLPASAFCASLRTERSRALFAGVAAHAMTSLTQPTSSAVGLLLAIVGHRFGWPVVKGGTGNLTQALVAALQEAGGAVHTGVKIAHAEQIPPADIVMLDMSPRNAARVLGHRLPPHVRKAYQRYRHGPGLFKLDLAIHSGIPWTDPLSRKAGTVHVAGSARDIFVAEREVALGRLPERPFVLVAQQYLADPDRSDHDIHPVYAYAHVPARHNGDVAESILEQIERFAPGTRDRIIHKHARTPLEIEATNSNNHGGDVLTGASTPLQLLARPRLTTRPYHTGVPGTYLCSAATPPGAGTHGMSGYNAAQTALQQLLA